MTETQMMELVDVLEDFSWTDPILLRQLLELCAELVNQGENGVIKEQVVKKFVEFWNKAGV